MGVEERLQDGKERGQKTASSVPDHYRSSVVARVSHEARVIQVSIMSGAQRFLKFKLVSPSTSKPSQLTSFVSLF